MNWYEAIFGNDIWKHLAMEISFWGHTEDESKKRMTTRKVLNSFQLLEWNYSYSLQIDETKFAYLLNKEIHEKHKNLPDDLEIPFLFIDPVSHIFKDPCDNETRGVTVREKEQYRKYTDRYKDTVKVIMKGKG